MTIAAIIGRVFDAKPNAYSEDTLLGFLNTLEGRVQREVWLLLPEETAEPYDWGRDRNRTPLMPAPYDEAYFWYLCAMVDALNGEYTKMQNTMILASELLAAYQAWFIATYEPAQTDAFIARLQQARAGGGAPEG